ncbi:MAG TPA: hypothetical protein VFN48_09375 [Solirubrobacteraceae bacterium]|nr:hypothetical protein [Solirubrobacteraceae bacterium]
MNRPRLALAALSVALLLVLAVSVGSAGALGAPLSPLADCQKHQGTLTHTYSAAQLERALRSMSPSVREYTTCNGTLQDQLDKVLGTAGTPVGNLTTGSGSGGGSGTVILVIVLVLVVLGGAGTAAVAWRRNRGDGSAA